MRRRRRRLPIPPSLGNTTVMAGFRDLPSRQKLVHLESLGGFNRPIVQFLTVCVMHRRPILADPEIADLLVEAWKKADRWLVGRYVIMPDHLHFICAPADLNPFPLAKWMAYWRNEVTRRWRRPSEKPIWQRDWFDRQLRTGESYDQKWAYFRENPVRAGLVRDASE